MKSKKIKVLIVDDSAVARDLLERGLSMDPEIEVVGKASDAWIARDRIVFLKPDVITLDVEMPRMNGIEFLKKLLPQYPIPVVIVSAVTGAGSERSIEALSAGAVAVVGKPQASDREGLAKMVTDLASTIKEAVNADISKFKSETPKTASIPVRAQVSASDQKIIAIGASTGGTSVLNMIIPQFPENSPGIVIVQHMPPVFTRLFAEALDKTSKMRVKEAKTGDLVVPGRVLVAPGDYHMRVIKQGTEWRVDCADTGDKVNGHRPSVDVLFYSVASAAGRNAVGCLLTGMGRDGADGLLEMRRQGARCFSQDKETSVVFGMPKEAWDNGAAERLVPAEKVTETLLGSLTAGHRQKTARSAL